MKNRTASVTAGILAWIMGAGSITHAEGALGKRPCLRGNEPAATLLFPYFEVDLSRPWDGRTTLIAITNVEAVPTLARAVVWSNWGAPVLAFDIYLAGHDVQTINLRDVLGGTLPRTGAATSPHGMTSEPPVEFQGCHPENVASKPLDVDFVRKALAGQEVHGGCWSSTVEEDLAVGYVTVDVALRCADSTPVDPGYFAGDGSGVAGYRNTLMGDWFMVHPGQDFAQGLQAVHLAADRDFFAPGDSTFYRRLVNGSASDARVPLSSTWGVRYAQGGGFSAGTQLLLWREWSRKPDPPAPGPCSAMRSWVDPIVFHNPNRIFDEEGNVVAGDPPIGAPPGDVLWGVLATQARSTKDFPFSFGWIEVALIEQAWLGMVMSAEGRYSVGVSGTPLFDLCTAGDGPPA